MKRFTKSELILRVPVIVVGLYLNAYWAFHDELKHLLIFWGGAWFWEYCLFIATRFGITQWKDKNDSDE